MHCSAYHCYYKPFCRDQCTCTPHSAHSAHCIMKSKCGAITWLAVCALRLTAKTNSGQITDTRLALLCTALPPLLPGCWLVGCKGTTSADKLGQMGVVASWSQRKEYQSLLWKLWKQNAKNSLPRVVGLISLPLCWQLGLHPSERQSRNRALESTKSLGKKNKDKP